MTHFLDGPAKGKSLMCRYSPIWLRVVIDNRGNVDALDAPDDEARPNEAIYLYRIKERQGTAHVNMGRGRGGFYPIQTYELESVQPIDENMRDNKKFLESIRLLEGK